MLLRVYFLSFVLYFNIIFCYEYKQENYNSKHSNGRFRNSERKRCRGQNHRRSGQHKEALAQIDLASFIQGPDDQLENSQSLELKSKSGSNDYDSLDSMESMLKKNMESLQNYNDLELDSVVDVSNIPLNNKNRKDQIKANAVADPIQNRIKNNFVENHFRHTPEKKCIFKSMKFPFFYPKNNTEKLKKNRKRRLFGLNKKKKHTTTTMVSTKFLAMSMISNKPTKYPQKMYKLKRSYFKKLCPSCRRSK